MQTNLHLTAVRDDDLLAGFPRTRAERLDLLHDFHALDHGACKQYVIVSAVALWKKLFLGRRFCCIWSGIKTSPQKCVGGKRLSIGYHHQCRRSIMYCIALIYCRSPNTTCLPSNQPVLVVQRKNCEPLVFGPALAMDKMPRHSPS